MGALQKFTGVYLQFLILVGIALVFAYVLNPILSIQNDEMRIMLSALFLAGFAGVILVFEKL